jgi:DNA-binding response OmpR family regulator
LSGDPGRLIAVVDDERDILDLVALHLARSGYRTALFEKARPFLDSLSTAQPALAVLDLMLPDIPGFEVCRIVRTGKALPDLPIIMLTALGSETDRITGLETGADDYLPKPFSPAELVARVKAVLRRSEPPAENGMIEIGGILRIDTGRFEASLHGIPVHLTPTEFRILLALAEGRGRVFSREMLLEKLWDGEKQVFDRTIDVHVTNLRAKLGDAGAMIRSVRGAGYRLVGQ